MPKAESVSSTSLTFETPPDEGGFIAYRVSGDFNYPALFDGDTVYTRAPDDPVKSVGKQCIATLSSGQKRICILGRGTTEGLFLLHSINASPIIDAEVIEAAPVVWIRREAAQ